MTTKSSPASNDDAIVILGGGPAGMACALALIKVGFKVRVFERYDRARPAGNILNLWPPPIHALKCMGVDVEDLGAPCRASFRNASGHVRADVKLPQDVLDKYGGGFIGLLRRDLYVRMLEALPAGTVEFGRQVVAIEDLGHRVELTLQDGSVVATPLLVGADGIDSTAWPESRPDPDKLKERALDGAAGFPHGPLRDLVAATPAENMQTWRIRDREPLARWSRGRITLAGDAAHATSPYAAYGAGMSICDGYFLAKLLRGTALDDTAAVAGALRQYDACRIPHTSEQVNLAYFLGRMFHQVPWPLTVARDLVLDWTGLLQREVGERSPGEIVKQLDEMGEGLESDGLESDGV
uniref:Zeaxanthin epoxidase n=1 Tax=Pyricularia oryzae (strain P131) TaxID=1143193 RepID=L7JNV0_PYRO1